MSNTKRKAEILAALSNTERVLFLGERPTTGRPSRRLTPAEESTVVRLVDSGFPALAIAEALRLARNTISRTYKRIRGTTPKPFSNAPAGEDVRRQIASLIAAGHLSDTEIARTCGVTRATVYRYRHPRNDGRLTAWPEGVPMPEDVAATRDAPPAGPPPVPTPRDASDRLTLALARIRAVRERAEANLNPAPAARPTTRPALAEVPLKVRACIPAGDASRAATMLEKNGWRAESISMGDSNALVEVRDLRQRGHPLVATLRTPQELALFLKDCGPGLTQAVTPFGSGRINGKQAITGTSAHWPPHASLSTILPPGAVGPNSNW